MFLRSILFILTGSVVLFSCRDHEIGSGGPDGALVESGYLYGELLEEVQKQGIFSDEKTFVDCQPKSAPAEILARYLAARDSVDFDLKAFVTQCFDPPWRPIEPWFGDSLPTPEEFIRSSWEALTRVNGTEEPGTLLPLPNPYIVAGGRYREAHYWDSYFIMLGLATDGRVREMQAMVENYAYLIDTYGYVPGGNRTYYLGCSGPPVFAAMVQMLAAVSGEAVYRQYLPQLEKEYGWWMDGSDSLNVDTPAFRRVVRLSEDAVLNRYWSGRSNPRAENFVHDTELAAENSNGAARVCRELRAAAESRWENASRWQPKAQNATLLRPTKYIPPDLNALLYNLENVLVKANQLAENVERVAFFLRAANARKEAILRYCWDPEVGFFTDFDFERFASSGLVTVAGIFPMCFNIATHEQGRACTSLIREGLLKPGGVANTVDGAEPNPDSTTGLASFQWMSITALRNYGEVQLAGEIRSRWLSCNLRMYERYGQFFDRYNVLDTTEVNRGVAFPAGFGMTNGVLLRLLSE